MARVLLALLLAVVSATVQTFDSPQATFASFSRRLAEVAEPMGNLGSDAGKYQTFLWVTVTLVLTAFAAVGALVSMTGSRDPLLYAKFRPSTDGGRR
mmetsp:Transcript_32547/g.78182  ORF Transcript_32547/g.78182 Transcript_32547/m.78182 type:complete len:97 (+) Transcript_32547:66-356(+)